MLHVNENILASIKTKLVASNIYLPNSTILHIPQQWNKKLICNPNLPMLLTPLEFGSGQVNIRSFHTNYKFMNKLG